MSKARNIADIGSHDVIETDSDGVTVTGDVSAADLTLTGAASITSGLTVGNASYPSTGPLTNRNKIINGAMVIDQRNAGSAVTANGDYPVDRFRANHSTDGAFSAQQDSSAPAGFVKSLKFTATTADGTLTGAQNLVCFHRIEGNNIADLAWGTASAKPVTLSFWVRSSLTGTFGGAFSNSATDRNYPFTYTISSADTWEYKTVTVAGDTSGTWLTTDGVGIRLSFGLGAGPDRSNTAGAWTASNSLSATGAVSVIGTLNATWQITGVQLEVGDTATPFEHRSYGQELTLCQRYYCKSYPADVEPGIAANADVSPNIMQEDNGANGRYNPYITFPVEMRATPSVVLYPGRASVSATAGNITQYNANIVSAASNVNPTKRGIMTYIQAGTGWDQASFNFTADAEL